MTQYFESVPRLKSVSAYCPSIVETCDDAKYVLRAKGDGLIQELPGASYETPKPDGVSQMTP
jgi:hypothetical protein